MTATATVAPPHEIWQNALNDLANQMTEATFETHLAGSRLVESGNGTWHVAVNNERSAEWLQQRLNGTVRRTVSALAGKEIAIKFVVVDAPPPAPEPETFDRVELARLVARDEIIAFDVYEAGYSPHAHYIQQFWGAYWGADAMQVWNYIRSYFQEPRYIYDRTEKKFMPNPNWTDWTPPRKYRPSDLARAIKSKNKKDPYRRKITGGWVSCHRYKTAYDEGEEWDACHHCTDRSGRPRVGHIAQAKPSAAYPEGRPTCRYWKPGLFEYLAGQGALTYQQIGDPDKARTIFYEVSIFQALPILTPAQVSTLNQETQREHKEWLHRHGIDFYAWEREESASFVPEVAR